MDQSANQKRRIRDAVHPGKVLSDLYLSHQHDLVFTNLGVPMLTRPKTKFRALIIVMLTIFSLSSTMVPTTALDLGAKAKYMAENTEKSNDGTVIFKNGATPEKAVAYAKAGVTGKELDSICRDHITKAGYGEYFKHGTGHGLGLDVHEAPRVSQMNDQPLELGACVTVEPGIYITGLGGIRIEDDIILTEEGCLVLNEFPKKLIRL